MKTAVIHTEDLSSLQSSVAIAVKNCAIWEWEGRLTTPSGQLKWIQGKSRPQHTLNGIVWDGLLIDFTDRKLAEEALHRSEARSRAYLSAIPDLINIIDSKGVFQEVVSPNPAIDAIPPGVDRVGQSVLDLLPSKEGIRQFQAVRAALETQTVQMYEQQIWMGNRHQYEEVRISPCDDQMALAIIRDITDRKHAELALQHITQQLQAFLDNAPAIISLFDTDGQYLRVNPAFEDVLGVTESQIVGRSFADFLPESVVTAMKSRIQTLIETRQPLDVEDELIVNGDRRIFQSILFPVVTLGETPTTFWAIAIDITDRKAVEQMKDEFISIVSHELRTPLTSIHGSLGLLAAGIYDNNPAKAKHMLDIAATDCDRLVRLVNEILTLERLESNHLQMEKSVCDTADLIQQAVNGMQAIAEKASITLATEPISAQIWANPDAILQTLTNLLSNAIKFSPAQSTVSVAAEIETNMVKFRVSDRGRGIPPDKLTTIFERFQQVDASDSRQQGGTGLGLAICQSFITQHGGKIWAESTVGEGSTFFFTVPIAKTDAP
ncbi:MAG: PAS domain-containing sensor histidine kinase [Elainellaceae cyanobacterium]